MASISASSLASAQNGKSLERFGGRAERRARCRCHSLTTFCNRADLCRVYRPVYRPVLISLQTGFDKDYPTIKTYLSI